MIFPQPLFYGIVNENIYHTHEIWPLFAEHCNVLPRCFCSTSTPQGGGCISKAGRRQATLLTASSGMANLNTAGAGIGPGEAGEAGGGGDPGVFVAVRPGGPAAEQGQPTARTDVNDVAGHSVLNAAAASSSYEGVALRGMQQAQLHMPAPNAVGGGVHPSRWSPGESYGVAVVAGGGRGARRPNAKHQSVVGGRAGGGVPVSQYNANQSGALDVVAPAHLAPRPGELPVLPTKPVTSKWKFMPNEALTVAMVPQLLSSYNALLRQRAAVSGEESLRDPNVPDVPDGKWTELTAVQVGKGDARLVALVPAAFPLKSCKCTRITHP